jgi:hypothetical protein
MRPAVWVAIVVGAFAAVAIIFIVPRHERPKD